MNPPAPPSVAVFQTRLDWMAVLRRGDLLLRITIGQPSADAARRAIERASNMVAAEGLVDDGLFERLIDYGAGGGVEIADVPLYLADLNRFNHRSVRLCQEVP